MPTALQWKYKDDRNDEFWGHQFFTRREPADGCGDPVPPEEAGGHDALKITDAPGKDVRDDCGSGVAQSWRAFRRSAGTCACDPRAARLRRLRRARRRRRSAGGGAGGGRAAAAVAAVPGVPDARCRASGVDPTNPCGGAAVAVALVAVVAAEPGTVRVARHLQRGADGGRQVVDTKPMRVVLDPPTR